MELWDLYNERRELTGRDHIRGEEIPQGFYHLVVHVWIRNSRGEYLISQRSADRPAYPFMWECVGGSVLKGEDSLTGAIRETKEEVGLTLSPEAGKLIDSVVGRVVNGVRFTDIWIFGCLSTMALFHWSRRRRRKWHRRPGWQKNKSESFLTPASWCIH